MLRSVVHFPGHRQAQISHAENLGMGAAGCENERIDVEGPWLGEFGIAYFTVQSSSRLHSSTRLVLHLEILHYQQSFLGSVVVAKQKLAPTLATMGPLQASDLLSPPHSGMMEKKTLHPVVAV